MLSRYAYALPRCLQDVRADNVIITYKTCRQVAIVLHYSAASHS
jgi:hypothetical protein